MKYFILGIMWLTCVWVQAIVINFLPAPKAFEWWALPLLLTYVVVFLGYTGYFLWWAYKQMEKYNGSTDSD